MVGEMSDLEIHEVFRRHGIGGCEPGNLFHGTLIARRLRALESALQSIATGEGLGEGCGDNSCTIRRPRGMATNGGCRCAKRDGRPQPLRMAVQRARKIARDALESEVGGG